MSRQRNMGGYRNLIAGRYLSSILIAATLIFSLTQTAICSDKRVELILDASGSMTGFLPSGERKIDVAKRAVEKLMQGMTPETNLAFRAYGHQSHRNKKDCKDTELLVDFATASENREQIIAKTKALKAQGYTPITYVLELAAKDFTAKKDEEHIIVLVSDGKETCEGDPCATAKALFEAGISKLTVHTVGFGVDAATRSQLECIARVSGGRYFSAESTSELVDALATAVEVVSVPKIETETVIALKKKKQPGFLKIVSPDMMGHDIIDAATGKKVGNISNVSSGSGVKLKEGIYNVTVGAGLWKSIEVKAGETTAISPGRLTVDPAGIMGLKIHDSETGKEHGSVSNIKNSIVLMPGLYDVVFDGEATWSVEIKEGENTLLQPGVVKIVNGGSGFMDIRNSKSQKVGYLSRSLNYIPLPPGDYTIEMDGEEYPFSLKAAETKTFRLE